MIKIESFSSPVHVSINTTAKCNLNCSHCSGDYGTIQEDEMDWIGWQKVLGYLKYANVYTVNLTGGEPTQSPYLFDILDSLRSNNIYATLSSNLVFGKKTFQRLLLYKDIIRNIKTSIDGYDAEMNGIIRRAKQFDSHKIFDIITENYYGFRKAGLNITVTTVLHKKLISKIDKMVDFIIDIKPHNWVVSPLVSIGRARHNSSQIMPEFDAIMTPDYEKIKNTLSSFGISFSQVDFPSKDKVDPYGCPACNESVIINYDGQVAPCQLSLEILPHYGYTFPNVLHTDFENIWESESFENFRKAQKHGCFDCQINGQCKRCIPQSLRYFHDELSPTPYCISVADLIGLKNKTYWEQKLNAINLEDDYEKANT